MKITNATALASAIANLTMTVNDGATLYEGNGVNQFSLEESKEIVNRLTAMLESTIKRAESSKNRERKPTAKEIAIREGNARLAQITFEKMNEHPNFLYECKSIADTMGVSVPKMARILATLVADGKVERIEGKKPNFKVKGE